MSGPLTTPQPGSLNDLMAANPPGMAWIAGTGPKGETCRTCAHWRRTTRPTYDVPTEKKPSAVGRTFELKPRPCGEFTRLMRANVREVIGDDVPASTPACRNFALMEGEPAPLAFAEYPVWKTARKAKCDAELASAR